jgi:hypothetical protein
MAYGRKTGGRKKGVANKVTQGAKENIMQVFEMIGGAQGFAEWASENRTAFYTHYAKLIPIQMTGGLDHQHVVEYRIVDPKA